MSTSIKSSGYQMYTVQYALNMLTFAREILIGVRCVVNAAGKNHGGAAS